MKKIIIILILLIYSTAFGLTIDSDNTAKVKVDARNLVTNGDFEENDGSEGDNWNVFDIASIVSGNGFDGVAQHYEYSDASLRLSQTGLSITSGKKYRVSFDYRSNINFRVVMASYSSSLANVVSNSGNATHFSQSITADYGTGANGLIGFGTPSSSAGDWIEISNIELVDITNRIIIKK